VNPQPLTYLTVNSLISSGCGALDLNLALQTQQFVVVVEVLISAPSVGATLLKPEPAVRLLSHPYLRLRQEGDQLPFLAFQAPRRVF